MRAAIKSLRAEKRRLDLIWSRINAGQFQGGSAYVQVTDSVSARYTAATAIWDDPEKLLPYAEEAVMSLMLAEEFNAPRVANGVEEPQLLPQLEAARWRAEAVVLKLREKVKKK